MNTKASTYTQVFNAAYNKLNKEQKEAVDRIEGPVMVNAGPGTGKTQILATRIGKILLEQDVAPHNILCLTYTDSATIAMRKRLVKFIGPTAHQVHIYTFHGFCNQVIQENLDIFGGYRQLEPITDLESVDVFRTIIDNLEDKSPLKRFKYDRYFEGKRMKHLFQFMKKENLTPEKLQASIQDYIADLPNKEGFTYKKKYTNRKTGKTYVAGDLNDNKINKEIQKYNELIAAVDQYDNFVKIMDQSSRYDFHDMILWVLEHFEKNDSLLTHYQERYHYFLVDEYQDTNGAQNKLLNQLVSYWDEPNVFVVGDDDQAIYKFQGANLGNILEFQNKYNPHTIVLEKNYRSNQHILNKAKDLIQFNEERMVVQVPGLTKELLAAGPHKLDKTIPKILSYPKISHEYAHLISQLKNINDTQPAKLSKIAIIYRKHRQVEDLVSVLEKLEIPLNIKRRINILELPLIRNILNLLNYLNEELNNYEDGQHRLFEILHYKYFGNNPLDIGKIALYCQRPIEEKKEGEKTKKIYPKWREVIADENILQSLNLSQPETILKTAQFFDQLVTEIPIITLQSLFEKMLNDGGVLKHIMRSNDKAWKLQVVSTFFDLIKNETAKNPKLNLKTLLSMIKKMEENDIALPINKTISSEAGLNFITAHSAKGLEFETVYMIGCTKNIWDGGSKFMGQYSFPDTVNADNKSNTEDERRLFYVAMTRAETELFISYSDADEPGKELGASQFVDELQANDNIIIEHPAVDENTLAEFYFKLLERKEQTIPLIEKDLIDKWMDGYKLSVTHLNKYLNCPLSFYFESILRVPSARNAATGFGTAMHYALNKFFEKIQDESHRKVEKLLFYFEENLLKHRSHFTEEEFKNYLTHGKRTLQTLHKEKLSEWLAIPKYALEEELANAVYKGVPLKGFIDKVEIFKDHVNVVDYKTGKYRPQKLQPISPKNEKGGDYWRQIVFYKMLLDSDTKNGWNMAAGKIEFIEPDRKTGQFAQKEFAVTPDDLIVVGKQIVETHEKIKNYDFDKTCEEPKCRWCNFVTDNYELKPDESDEHSYDN